MTINPLLQSVVETDTDCKNIPTRKDLKADWSGMPAEAEHMRRVSSEAALPTVPSAPENADDMLSQSDESATNLNAQQLEIDVADSTGAWHVSIDDLPDEMMIKIFSHMSFRELVGVVRKVCSRWSRLSQDEKLWADKEYYVKEYFTGGYSCFTGGTTDQEAIQTFCDVPNLRRVMMERAAKSRVFRMLYNRCHRLSELRLCSTQKLSYSVMKNLVHKCPGIHTLGISIELLKSEKFSDAVSHLQQLRVLEIYVRHPQNSFPVLRPLGDGCPRLTEVDFGSANVDMDDLRYFLNAKRSTIKSIRIKSTMTGKRCVLPMLTLCADSLERLELHKFDQVCDEAREAFTALGNLKNLQELKMSLTGLPPPGTAALAFKNGGLPKLTRLDLQGELGESGVDDDTVIAISHGCPALRELVVRCIERLSDAAFSQIHCLELLEELDISACKGLGGALIPCLARLPRLHTLWMKSLEFPKLQPGLRSIVELSSLRCLILDYSLVAGVPFDKFPEKLVSLRKLSIMSCRWDLKAIDGLAEEMPDLEILEEPAFYMYDEESGADLADV